MVLFSRRVLLRGALVALLAILALASAWLFQFRPSPAGGAAPPASAAAPPAAASAPESASVSLQVADVFLAVAGSFAIAENAERLAERLGAQQLPAFVQRDGAWHIVVIGPYATAEEAREIRTRLVDGGLPDARVLRRPAPDPAGSEP